MRRKNSKLGGIAIAGIASALLAAACKGGQDTSFTPSSNSDSTLYDSPVTTSDNYDPSLNYNNDVYGPPEEMEKQPSGGITFEQIPSDGMNAHDLSGNLREDVSGDDDFKPADNIAEPVYGPPAGNNEATE